MPSTINADNGVVSGSAGLKYASDNSGVLALQTNGNTAVTITTANNVGIGTTSPINPLDVVGNVRSMLQTTGDQTGISLGNNGSTNPRIQFSTSDGSPRYFIQGNGNSSLDFVTVLAGTNYTAMSLGRTTNNLVFGQNGSGIQFTNSSASTNSVLNDYEQGTWTPVISFGGASTGITYSVNSGNYTKIGNMVYAHGTVYLSSKGSSTGTATITLPFATKSGPPYDGPRASGILGQYAAFTSVSNGVTIMADHTSTVAAFFQGNNGSGLTDANFQNSTQMYGFSIVYQANF